MTRITAAPVFLAALCAISFAAPTAYAVEGEGEIVNKAGEEALIKSKFTGTSGLTTLEGAGGAKATCTSATATGLVLNTSEGEQTIAFKGCESMGVKCNSEGAATGEIKLTLTAVITTVKKTDKALLAFTVSKSAYTEGIFSFKCGGLFTVRLRGTFLVPVGESQEHKLKTKDTFTAEQSGGLQKPTTYENERSETVKDALELETPTGKKFEQAGIGSAEEVTFEEEVEFLGFERYEFVNSGGGEVSDKAFTMEGGTSTLSGENSISEKLNIECKKNKGKGEVLGRSRLKKILITFEGCEETIKKCAVRTSGAASGEVVTNDLLGELGETGNFFTGKAGLDLQPEAGTTVTSMQGIGGSCNFTFFVTGDVIGVVEPEDTLREKIEVVYKSSSGTQEWTKIEEEGSGGFFDSPDYLIMEAKKATLVDREVFTFKEQVKVLTR